MSTFLLELGILAVTSSVALAARSITEGHVTVADCMPFCAPHSMGYSSINDGEICGKRRKFDVLHEASITSSRSARITNNRNTEHAASTGHDTVYLSISGTSIALGKPAEFLPVAGPTSNSFSEVRTSLMTTGSTSPATIEPNSKIATTSASTIGLSKGKAGVAFDTAVHVGPFIGKPNIGWCYNWNAIRPTGLSGIEYIPVLWGLDNVHLDSWFSAANSALREGATAVIGFNEPDHKDQANLDIHAAAVAYKQHITDNFAGKAKLVSPSVTNGGAPMGLTYLQDFMVACSSCGIEAINIHWYDSSRNIDYFKRHIQDAYERFKLPIWLTEFGSVDGNDQAFLAEVLPWLNSQSFIERYAYFMAKEGLLLSAGQLSGAGNTYANAGSKVSA